MGLRRWGVCRMVDGEGHPGVSFFSSASGVARRGLSNSEWSSPSALENMVKKRLVARGREHKGKLYVGSLASLAMV